MDNSQNQISLLYVDDEAILLDATQNYLEHTGDFTVATTRSAKEALCMIQEQEYDIIISDYQMPEMDGLEFLKTLRASGNTIPFIIFTGRGREEVAIEALNAGADFYLQKGGKPKVQFGELQNFVTKAVEKSRAEKLYQTVFENTGTAMVIIEEDTTISHINEEMEKLWGFSRKNQEFMLKWTEHVVKEDLEKMIEYHRLRRNDPDSAPKQYEFRMIHKNGKIINVSLTATMISRTKKSVISLIDITEQKKAEKKLMFTEFVVENAGEAIFWTDPKGQIISANKTAQNFFPYSKEEFLRKSISDIDPNIPPKRFRELWDEMKEKGSITFQKIIPKKAGGSFTVELNTTILNFEGKEYSCCFLRDITDRKQAEEDIKQDRLNLKAFFNATDSLLYVLDEQGFILAVNETLIHRIGYSKEELIGQSVRIVHPPEQHDEAMHQIQEILTGTIPFSRMPVIAKNGHVIQMETRVTRGVWDGKPAIFGIDKDISQLKSSEDKFSAAFQSNATLMTIQTKKDGTYRDVNDTFIQTLSFSQEEIIGKSAQDLNLFADPEDYSNALCILEEKGTVRNLEISIMTKDGDLCYGLLSMDNLMVDETPCLLTTIIDITDMKQAETALKALNKKINLLSAITRHDIINQLCGLLIYEELLKDAIDEETATKYLEPIIRATEMIEDMISFTRDYQDLGVNAPTWHLVESMGSSVVSHSLENKIQVNVDTNNLEIFADPMLHKVFNNLFDNAARYGEHVTEITVSFHEKEGNGIVVIEDNGVGIPNDRKEKIFEHGVGQNTGFGLFLTREILGITGISIAETGREGNGARFEITVPKGAYRFRDKE